MSANCEANTQYDNKSLRVACNNAYGIFALQPRNASVNLLQVPCFIRKFDTAWMEAYLFVFAWRYASSSNLFTRPL